MNIDNPQEGGRASQEKGQNQAHKPRQSEGRQMTAQQLAIQILGGNSAISNKLPRRRKNLPHKLNFVQSQVDETLNISHRDAVSYRKNNVLPRISLVIILGRSSATYYVEVRPESASL